MKLAAPVSIVMLLSSVPAYAETPTNEQLFKMLQDMQQKVGALQDENSVLKKELNSVKSNAANPGQARVTAATTKLYGALSEFMQEIDPNMEGSPNMESSPNMGAMPEYGGHAEYGGQPENEGHAEYRGQSTPREQIGHTA